MTRLVPWERETSMLWDGTPGDAYVGSNIQADIKAMEKLWGPATRVYDDGPAPWHVWRVPKSQARLPRPKSQKRAAATRAKMASKG